MKISKFGQKIAARSGIGQLMDDLGLAAAAGGMIMLGGGNPAHIPAVEARFRGALQKLLDRPGQFERAVGEYDPPGGNRAFVEAMCQLLGERYGWPITPANIALTNGSQSAFFILFNLFAGPCEDGSTRKICLPLAPEYIGYSDVGLVENVFTAARPEIDHLDEHIFKYRVDFDALHITDDIGAVCVSRPTNPTGNVLTDDEIARLGQLTRDRGIPLIIDNAYGAPFPNIIFTEVRPVWDDNTIVCMSLSKLGLPAARTGIIIANEAVIAMISQINAIMSLAPGGLGAAMATEMVRTGEIIELSREVIRPFYQRRAESAVAQLMEELAGIDFHIHKPEGAFFLWLWLRGLPITCGELYERLKARGVLVVPGHYFFPGMDEPWRHKDECIRVNYAPDEPGVRKGLSIIADEVRRAYRQS